MYFEYSLSLSVILFSDYKKVNNLKNNLKLEKKLKKF